MPEENVAPPVEQQPAAVPEPPPAEPAAPAEPPRAYTQEEVDKITAKVRKNERYRTRKEVEAFYQGRESVAQPRVQEPAQQPPADKAPERGQFATYEEFIEAKAAHTARNAARQEREQASARENEQRAREQAAERAKTFQAKVEERFPDLGERIAEVGDMPMHRGVQEAISESDFGPEILNELVGKPSELERLSKLSESSAVREIGKMEARFEAAAKAAKPASDKPANQAPTTTAAQEPGKAPSSAPAPITPVGGARTQPNEGDALARLVNNPDAWQRERNKQLQRRRTGT